MIVGRLFKAAILIGGGVFAFGSGALGTHFAYPHLESKLNPQRKQREEKLQQSFNEANKQVDRLGKDLVSQNKLSVQQKLEISKINEDLNLKKTELDEKSSELQRKNELVQQKIQEIDAKDKENKAQETQISDLNGKLEEKENELSDTKNRKEKHQQDLDYLKSRLALTEKNILSSKGLEKRSLNIKIRTIKKKSTDGVWTTFSTENYDSTTKEFKVKKPNKFLNHEEKANEIKTKGILFSLVDEFKTWDKKIQISRYDVDYGYTTSDSSKIRAFVLNNKEENFKISDYFQSNYWEEAFKVLVAISQLENFPFKHDLSDTSIKKLEFCQDMNAGQDFITTNRMTWSQFTATEDSKKIFVVETNMFVTSDDFINYWMKKTVEFVRTGTVDLFDFINPMLLSENYQSN